MTFFLIAVGAFVVSPIFGLKIGIMAKERDKNTLAEIADELSRR